MSELINWKIEMFELINWKIEMADLFYFEKV